ncbi:hypothetical protein [Curtobacterium sp. MCSS17_011]|uniref:hypothetical protein n=1 Tax=Curtobacterium sp. MCSS17_011 TaxID=2175643 RepID=UPI0021AC5CD4|nr:hypothetical protein [Curtobacterium sp. MCSS17_011]
MLRSTQPSTPVSWTAREDAAEAAAAILLADQPFDGPVTLTTPDAPTFADLARLASEVSGRMIGFEALGEDEWRARALAAGQDPHMVAFLLGMYQAAERGLFAGTDPLLGELLGRTPRPVRDQLS